MKLKEKLQDWLLDDEYSQRRFMDKLDAWGKDWIRTWLMCHPDEVATFIANMISREIKKQTKKNK